MMYLRSHNGTDIPFIHIALDGPMYVWAFYIRVYLKHPTTTMISQGDTRSRYLNRVIYCRARIIPCRALDHMKLLKFVFTVHSLFNVDIDIIRRKVFRATIVNETVSNKILNRFTLNTRSLGIHCGTHGELSNSGDCHMYYYRLNF